MKICDKCQGNIEPDTAWPGKDGKTICQTCWEAECDEGWWEMVEAAEKIMEGVE